MGSACSRTTCGAATEDVLKHGPDHLLWALCDDVVDGYFPFSDKLGDAIDEVQDEVMRKATPQTLERVFDLKRELIEVRRSISPVREMFNQLTNRDMPLVDENEIVYFRDVYDHLIRLTDELDMYRELAASTLDIYLTQVNNNLSVDHEATDRRDGHPGRHRRRGRDLRDERGRTRPSAAARPAGSGWSRASWSWRPAPG